MFPIKKSAKANVKKTKKDDKAAVKGLKSAGVPAPPSKGFAGGPPAGKGKAAGLVKESDPTKGLKDALKAKQIQALSQQVAAATGGA